MIYYKAGKYLQAINSYFIILKLNSSLSSYRDLWPLYHSVVKIVMNDYLPENGYDFHKMDEVFVDHTGTYSHNNFDEI